MLVLLLFKFLFHFGDMRMERFLAQNGVVPPRVLQRGWQVMAGLGMMIWLALAPVAVSQWNVQHA